MMSTRRKPSLRKRAQLQQLHQTQLMVVMNLRVMRQLVRHGQRCRHRMCMVMQGGRRACPHQKKGGAERKRHSSGAVAAWWMHSP